MLKEKLRLVIGRCYLLPDGVRVRLMHISPIGDSLEFFALSGPEAGQRVLYSHTISLRADNNTKLVCYCRAYRFPHHRGVGRCYHALD